MDKAMQDKRWHDLTEDGRQARIASYQELLEMQKEEANSYLITIEDLEKLYGKHNLQPTPMTYEDVARELFRCGVACIGLPYENVKWRDKLKALGDLLVVAKFLNKDWKPDWKDRDEDKWYLSLNKNEIRIGFITTINSSPVYFRTEELARQAIQILGEDTVRLALTTDF